MWHIIKSEFKYYKVAFIAPIFFTILFQVLEFLVLKTAASMDKDLSYFERIDLWGGFYLFILLYSSISVWATQTREKKMRVLTLLPVANNRLALSRFFFVLISVSAFVLYFIVTNIIVKSIWGVELSAPLLQLGLAFSLSASLIYARDVWFSHLTFKERLLFMLVPALIILLITAKILFDYPNTYGESVPSIQNYTDVIVLLFGLAIMFISIFSFQKRKSYLS